MFRPLELFIGLRYTRAKRRNHFISFISLISMLGIALGVTALITVLSVMNGFERELRERILGMASHATISGFNGQLAGWRDLADRAATHPEVVGVAPYVRGEAMLSNGQLVHATLVRGILPDLEPTVGDIQDFMIAGALSDLVPGAYRIILGTGLARSLGARVGSKVTLVAPQASVTPAGILPRLRRFTVAGIFAVNHARYDTLLALVHIRDAAKVFRLKEDISGLRLKLRNLYDAPRISRELARSFDGAYWVVDWTQHHANFFRALKTEKTVMFIILTLIVAVAAFNLVASLIMVVTDKGADIAILRTLGASPLSIMGIFMVQGTIIGLIGTLLGLVGGLTLAANVETLVPAIEQFLDTKFLSPEVYYISEVPSDLRWPDVIAICVVAFTMCIAATLYPAWRASRTQPAQALRYE